jgi:hypothetical protein
MPASVKCLTLSAMLLALAPFQAHAEDDAFFGQVGSLLGLRAYVLGAMEYCTKYVEARPEFAAAADAWKQRNADDSAALDKVAAPLVNSTVKDKMDHMLTDKIVADAAAASDKIAFCTSAMDAINSGNNDFATNKPSEIARVREAAAK